MIADASLRRRCAPRPSPCSPRSPWPAAPAAGVASARRGGTPRAAGAGCAVHRLAHQARHQPAHQSPRSCARSCGANAHLAPHRAGPSRPHLCGQLRLRPRQRAAHRCLRLRPRRPPLKRRGGFPPPGSPASIPPWKMQPKVCLRRACARRFLTPHASMMLMAHARAEPAFSTTWRDFRRLLASRYCLAETLLRRTARVPWRTVVKTLESLEFFRHGSLENRPGQATVLQGSADSGQNLSGEARRTGSNFPGEAPFQPVGAAGTEPSSAPAAPSRGPAANLAEAPSSSLSCAARASTISSSSSSPRSSASMSLRSFTGPDPAPFPAHFS